MKVNKSTLFNVFYLKYAQPIRLLLAYAEVDFEDTRYNYLPSPGVGDGWDRSEWTKEKDTLGLDFPNVLYQ